MSGFAWLRSIALVAIVTGGAIAVCMVVFRAAGWFWMPQSSSDQWAIAGVFGVVAGGAATPALMPERRSAESPNSRDAAGGEERDGSMSVKRSGQATARDGGHAVSGIRGLRNGQVRVDRSGDAEASGARSRATSGIDLDEQR